MTKNVKTTQNDENMHYKITIFGTCAPYPRLIYWIASCISQGNKDDMSSKSGPCLWGIEHNTLLIEKVPIKISKKVMTVQPEGRRKKRRPRLRWKDEINYDAKACCIRNWRMVDLVCEKWRRLRNELSSLWWWRWLYKSKTFMLRETRDIAQ